MNLKKTEYIILDKNEQPEWEEVYSLYIRMYQAMDQMGLMMPLVDGGAEKWLKTVKNTSGKFGIVFLAISENEPVGFAQGMIRFLPDYLGGQPVGLIGHIFVDEKCRRDGIGRELVKKLENWLNMKRVHSIELQVIGGNPGAAEFWKSIGYELELLQFRKIINL
jgi:GNAT superfamily N-acetyltransferase